MKNLATIINAMPNNIFNEHSIFDEFPHNLTSGFLQFPQSTQPIWLRSGQNLLPLDIVEKENLFLIRAQLPGVKREEMNISINERTLTIDVQRTKENVEKEEENVLHREIQRENISRSIQLRSPVNESNVKAKFTDGILEITLPKSTTEKPRKIEINAN